MATTTLGRAETRTISVRAPAETVFHYLSDARNLPEWAPAFAQAVEHDHGDVWRIEPVEGSSFTTSVRAASTHGVVDFGTDANIGLYTRVVPNLTGSELIFSFVFPDATPPSAVDAQMRLIEQELRTVREIAESERAA